MRSREAKDFLIQQTVEQAQFEHEPLSDLERRMMYFTETGEMPEDPFELNDAFEAQYDSAEYEIKISKLMRHAYSRLKKENPSSASLWDEAIRELGKGDHYLLVLLGRSSVESPPSPSLLGWSFWKLLGVSLLLLIIGMIFLVAVMHHAESVPPDNHRRSLERLRLARGTSPMRLRSRV